MENRNPFQQSHSVSTLSSKQSEGRQNMYYPGANNASKQWQMQKRQQAIRGLNMNMSGADSNGIPNA